MQPAKKQMQKSCFCSKVTQTCIFKSDKDKDDGTTCRYDDGCRPTDYCFKGHCLGRKHEGESVHLKEVCEDGLGMVCDRTSTSWENCKCQKLCIPGSLKFECGSGKTCQVTFPAGGICVDQPATLPTHPPTTPSSSTSPSMAPMVLLSALPIVIFLVVLVYLCGRRRREQPQPSFPDVAPNPSQGAMPVYTQSIYDLFMQPQPKYDPGPAPYPYTAEGSSSAHESSDTPPAYFNIYPDLPTAPTSH